ncbi:Transcription initiation factor TFIID subunit 1 [Bonamia ostreae]|uniref:Transcription initiation factor TFIID subunit 1 n=1 Tax=Bonamia ostreae TaxID=126728 RepID=A0ABV2AJM5_9EUKA
MIKRKSDDEDLRKISKNDAVKVLRKMGVQPNDLVAMTRWDLVSLIKELSTEDDEFAKYSRAHLDKKSEYAKNLNRIFSEHLRFLQNKSSTQKAARELDEMFGETGFKGQSDVVETDEEESALAEKVVESLMKGEDFKSENLSENQKLGNAKSIGKNGKRYKRVLKKRIILTICRPVPGRDPFVEVITDRDKILSYLDSKRAERQKELESLPHHEKMQKKEEIEKIRVEQLKKLELNRKNDLEKERKAIERSITNSHIRCTECGMRGHIKTNRSLCLKYLSNVEEEKSNSVEPSLVDNSSGDTIRINTAKVTKAVSVTKKKGKKRHIDLLNAIDEGVDLRNQRDPCIEFRNILVAILDRTRKALPIEAALFAESIPRENSTYHSVVTNPMSLSDIKKRAENSSRPYSRNEEGKRRREKGLEIRYTSAEEFLRDVELIFRNALLYFGPRAENRNSERAYRLVNFIKKALIPHLETISELSAEIHEAEKEQKLLDRLKIVVETMIASKYSFYFKQSPLSVFII